MLFENKKGDLYTVNKRKIALNRENSIKAILTKQYLT